MDLGFPTRPHKSRKKYGKLSFLGFGVQFWYFVGVLCVGHANALCYFFNNCLWSNDLQIRWACMELIVQRSHLSLHAIARSQKPDLNSTWFQWLIVSAPRSKWFDGHASSQDTSDYCYWLPRGEILNSTQFKWISVNRKSHGQWQCQNFQDQTLDIEAASTKLPARAHQWALHKFWMEVLVWKAVETMSNLNNLSCKTPRPHFEPIGYSNPFRILKISCLEQVTWNQFWMHETTCCRSLVGSVLFGIGSDCYAHWNPKVIWPGPFSFWNTLSVRSLDASGAGNNLKTQINKWRSEVLKLLFEAWRENCYKDFFWNETSTTISRTRAPKLKPVLIFFGGVRAKKTGL